MHYLFGCVPGMHFVVRKFVHHSVLVAAGYKDRARSWGTLGEATAIFCLKTKVQNHLQRLLAKERYKANKTKNASKLRRHELRTATGFVRLSFGIGNPWALGRHGALVWPLTVASAILCSLSRCLVCNILRNPSLAPLITFQGSPGSDSLHCRFRRDLREDLSASIGAKRLCAFQGDTSWQAWFEIGVPGRNFSSTWSTACWGPLQQSLSR